MPSITEITPSRPARLIGLPTTPTIIEVRTPDEFDADPRLLPTALRHDIQSVKNWAAELADRCAVVVRGTGRVVTFGGAYADLAYGAQAAVDTSPGWRPAARWSTGSAWRRRRRGG